MSSMSDTGTSLVGLDGEVAMHLKQLTKRDPTTKLKALQVLLQFDIVFSRMNAVTINVVIEACRFLHDQLRVRENRVCRIITGYWGFLRWVGVTNHFQRLGLGRPRNHHPTLVRLLNTPLISSTAMQLAQSPSSDCVPRWSCLCSI